MKKILIFITLLTCIINAINSNDYIDNHLRILQNDNKCTNSNQPKDIDDCNKHNTNDNTCCLLESPPNNSCISIKGKIIDKEYRIGGSVYQCSNFSKNIKYSSLFSILIILIVIIVY